MLGPRLRAPLRPARAGARGCGTPGLRRPGAARAGARGGAAGRPGRRAGALDGRGGAAARGRGGHRRRRVAERRGHGLPGAFHAGVQARARPQPAQLSQHHHMSTLKCPEQHPATTWGEPGGMDCAHPGQRLPARPVGTCAGPGSGSWRASARRAMRPASRTARRSRCRPAWASPLASAGAHPGRSHLRRVPTSRWQARASASPSAVLLHRLLERVATSRTGRACAAEARRACVASTLTACGSPFMRICVHGAAGGWPQACRTMPPAWRTASWWRTRGAGRS